MGAGSGHTCALYSNGTVACWGSSQFGQVGTGKNSNYPTPTLVSGLP
jgi:alpha-tubulin suppressor-like RCC1 family protein